jgi:dTDP-glucose 4,6-dehydratase
MKIVYVTGCCGFIGSYVTQHCLELGWRVIGVDKMTYASNPDLLQEFTQNPNFKFIRNDINNLERLMDCDYIINTAAESHVDNSIVDSDAFIHSNVNGVHHLLKLILHKRHALNMPTFLHFSTDEVYGDISSGQHFEFDLLKPSNPYSASKASADMLVYAWGRTFNIPYVIVRPTNNYGIGQYVEKLIPKSIKHLGLNRPIHLHDNGKPVRTWLHADDTARAITTIIESNVQNEIYNISGNTELPNKIVVQAIINNYFDKDLTNDWGKYIGHISRPGQDIRYSVNDDKLKKLGWEATADFDEELYKITNYYKDNFVW